MLEAVEVDGKVAALELSKMGEFALPCSMDAAVKSPEGSEPRAACPEFGPSLIEAEWLDPCSNVKCGAGDCSRRRLEGLFHTEVGVVR